jgi:hypothetical protein
MISCPFCGGRSLSRDAWGEGFGNAIRRYVGKIDCRACGGSMLAEFVPPDSEQAGGECLTEARRLATERWNRRADSGKPSIAVTAR